jgi:hypothetical protein
MKVLCSDDWYTKIFNSLFEEAAKYTWNDLKEGPFTGPFWGWMHANQHSASKKAILYLLLHPHIRSFRVRAALGKRDYQPLLHDLQLQPLDDNVPNVVGTYLLADRCHPHPKLLQADMGYCGQALVGCKTEGLEEIILGGLRGIAP